MPNLQASSHRQLKSPEHPLSVQGRNWTVGQCGTMSALGHKRTFRSVIIMSALPVPPNWRILAQR
jgi:hypothetical protein